MEDKNRHLQERLELVEKLQQMLQRETLPKVEAEMAQRVAVLSKVLLCVPEVKGGGCREGLLPCCPTVPLPMLLSPHRSAARLRWEHSLSVRQCPLLCHPYSNFPPVLSCVLCVPRTLQLRVTAAQSSVSHSQPSRIET